MAGKTPDQPVNPCHPAEILLEEFPAPASLAQSEFAKRIG